MEVVKILVSRQMDGYAFMTLPSTRSHIQSVFPHAHPSYHMFVSYEVNSDFESLIGRVAAHIYPILLGVDDECDLERLGDVQFVDSQTGDVLYSVTPREEKV